jgi:type II restriction/modification system DNA methylase subunit YeeA
MNTAQLKAYAPAARRAFIAAVTSRAALFGMTKAGTVPLNIQGDVVLIAGQAYPKKVADQRNRLERRICDQGFDQVVEAVAYTWFNRFVAIRFMELQGYLEHGYRVLSHPEGKVTPEILEHATEVALPGLDRNRVLELRLDGSKDDELYRLLLLSQCHALHLAMPFLFESLDDAIELLLPDRLLQTDSLLRHLVQDIDKSSWEQIEIIGWLYQFYISEKKADVIGQVVKSEDIPAATQLFTPSWIVKYMVQNTLGAQWLATYPDSPLKAQMEYYIEPAEQTAEVLALLSKMTPTALNPEDLTLIDPACGSGHILLEAYELLKAIYLERGYRQRDVAQLILEKNLFGLDIDERAAQLTGIALMMKGRADDPRLFERGVKLNVRAFVTSSGLDAEALANRLELGGYGLKSDDIKNLRRLFEHATTLGSLIQVPGWLAPKLPALKQVSQTDIPDLFIAEAMKLLEALVEQAEVLAAQYDVVVANPPYMGGQAMNSLLRKAAKESFPGSKSDLFAVLTERFFLLTKPSGSAGMMTPFTWMFLKAYEPFRRSLLDTRSLQSLVQPEYHSFFESAFVPICSFIIRACRIPGYLATFIKLSDFYGAELQPQKTIEAVNNKYCKWRFSARPDDFHRIPGSPIAYWLSAPLQNSFSQHKPLHEFATPRAGMITGNNELFLRMWHEVSASSIGWNCESRAVARESGCRWFPYQKGGKFRKWAGNKEWVVDWKDDGLRLRTTKDSAGKIPAHAFNEDFIFRPNVNWSKISSSSFSARVTTGGSLFDDAGSAAFPSSVESALFVAGFLNSKVTRMALEAINPTLNFQAWNIGNLPLNTCLSESKEALTTLRALYTLANLDWNSSEESWDFERFAGLPASGDGHSPHIELTFRTWSNRNRETIAQMKCLEEENNRLFIDAYGLAAELSPEVPIEQVTLKVNPANRYGGKLTEEELWVRFRRDTMEELVSYAIGCMMGRYSLDEPGLIYANSGNEGFDPNRYRIFPADADGVIPTTELAWFEDDAAERLVQFIALTWDKAHLEQNLAFLADNLGPKQGETSRETLRRYLATKFFNDHLQTYKKRPIYWLFSSGKQKAFQCLVYLHRYHVGTLSRIRTEYVIPLHGRFTARIKQLEADLARAVSTAQGRKLEQERASLLKQSSELRQFEEKLRHYADQRIHLDLDDGVKVNYGKFGDLLAEVDAVTGGTSD